MTDQDLISIGAVLVKSYGGYNGCIPVDKWEYKGRILEKLLCACCPGMVVWDWDSKDGRSNKLEDLLKAVK